MGCRWRFRLALVLRRISGAQKLGALALVVAVRQSVRPASLATACSLCAAWCTLCEEGNRPGYHIAQTQTFKWAERRRNRALGMQQARLIGLGLVLKGHRGAPCADALPAPPDPGGTQRSGCEGRMQILSHSQSAGWTPARLCSQKPEQELGGGWHRTTRPVARHHKTCCTAPQDLLHGTARPVARHRKTCCTAPQDLLHGTARPVARHRKTCCTAPQDLLHGTARPVARHRKTCCTAPQDLLHGTARPVARHRKTCCTAPQDRTRTETPPPGLAGVAEEGRSHHGLYEPRAQGWDLGASLNTAPERSCGVEALQREALGDLTHLRPSDFVDWWEKKILQGMRAGNTYEESHKKNQETAGGASTSPQAGAGPALHRRQETAGGASTSPQAGDSRRGQHFTAGGGGASTSPQAGVGPALHRRRGWGQHFTAGRRQQAGPALHRRRGRGQHFTAGRRQQAGPALHRRRGRGQHFTAGGGGASTSPQAGAGPALHRRRGRGQHFTAGGGGASTSPQAGAGPALHRRRGRGQHFTAGGGGASTSPQAGAGPALHRRRETAGGAGTSPQAGDSRRGRHFTAGRSRRGQHFTAGGGGASTSPQAGDSRRGQHFTAGGGGASTSQQAGVGPALHRRQETAGGAGTSPQAGDSRRGRHFTAGGRQQAGPALHRRRETAGGASTSP
ncbi:hypothetical protein NDU88_000149 [Pleurodeles waltl]|uniref:Uncharacterized protein n=1 Tax=Pleurodeles waltl TaxID=8319 RepID=A0AAV7KWA4_PLEWA|nr:hypothetical protein NDU88_000149 [Pleurodeles waltl]